MTNKEIVRSFIENVFNRHDLTVAKDYLKDDYLQHNPHVEQGADGFVRFFTGMFERAPGFHQEVQHMIAEDDYVVVHAKACGVIPGKYNKVVDIYRLENGKLAEHWDVLEHDIPED